MKLINDFMKRVLYLQYNILKPQGIYKTQALLKNIIYLYMLHYFYCHFIIKLLCLHNQNNWSFQVDLYQNFMELIFLYLKQKNNLLIFTHIHYFFLKLRILITEEIIFSFKILYLKLRSFYLLNYIFLINIISKFDNLYMQYIYTNYIDIK